MSNRAQIGMLNLTREPKSNNSNLYFYFRRSPELNNHPHLMIISSSKLDYEELVDYKQLISGLTQGWKI